MRWVPHAAVAPHRCAVVPFIGNSNAKNGFIDSGTDLTGWDPHVYISWEAFAEMAKIFHYQPMATRDELALARARASNYEARIAELEAENEMLSKRFDAIDVLASADFVARKKPGRPRTQHEEAVT